MKKYPILFFSTPRIELACKKDPKLPYGELYPDDYEDAHKADDYFYL